MIFTLQANQIEDFWHRIEPLLLRVKDPGWTPEDVKQTLINAHAQLWGMGDFDAIWITKIERTGQTLWALLWITAGTGLEEGLELFHTYTEPWLKSLGCEFVQIIGRKGWKRALPDYEERGIVLVKEL